MNVLRTVCLGFFAVSAFSIRTEARETGFEIGSEIHAFSLKGHLQVSCSSYFLSQTAPVEYDCEASGVLPDSVSRFQTAAAVDADSVTLTAVHEDGHSVTKDAAYMSPRGMTSEAINLLNHGFFKTPLLAAGMNDVTYVLKKAGTIVLHGQFNVVAKLNEQQQCKSMVLQSYDSADCGSRAHACQRYFFETNNCQ